MAVNKINSGIKNRTRLFEKTGLAITADGSDDILINVKARRKASTRS